MRNASPSRWLLLLAGLAVMSGCAQLPGGSAYPPVQLDSRLAAERYLSPASDPDRVAQTRALEGVWARMGTEGHTASAPAVVTAKREEPVITTSSVQMSAIEPPPGPPAGMVSDASRPRTLWDKQPWEVELDKTVRGICRGC
jgi:hypothetical protein